MWNKNADQGQTPAGFASIDTTDAMACSAQAQLPSAEDCLQEFDLDGDGLLSVGELGECLHMVLKRSGCEAGCSKQLSRQMLEEYSLRADGAAAGAGALSRLLDAAADRASLSRSRSPVQEERGHQSFGSVKEASLQNEAVAWAAPSRIATIPIASEDEIPTIDLATWEENCTGLVANLRDACKKVGFFFLVNHGVPQDRLESGVRLLEEFGDLPLGTKQRYEMDQGKYPGGTGYLPLHSRKLPKRPKGNVVEAFIVKREHGPRNIKLEHMPWPSELGTAWRAGVESYANTMESLACRLLPLFSLALGEDKSYLNAAFQSPLWRLRLSKYPACRGLLQFLVFLGVDCWLRCLILPIPEEATRTVSMVSLRMWTHPFSPCCTARRLSRAWWNPSFESSHSSSLVR